LVQAPHAFASVVVFALAAQLWHLVLSVTYVSRQAAAPAAEAALPPGAVMPAMHASRLALGTEETSKHLAQDAALEPLSVDTPGLACKHVPSIAE
jgi:hypothetical protein